MPNGLINLALGLAIQVGSPGPSEQPGYNPPQAAYGRYGSEGSSEPYHPNDSQLNWVHGYHQEIPAYGGHPVFRPYNYKDVLSQSQTAAGWGERPTMPYSQQFWHKYQDQAAMLKVSRNQTAPSPYIPVQHIQQQPVQQSFQQPSFQQQSFQQPLYPQQQGIYPQPQAVYPQPQQTSWIVQPNGMPATGPQLPNSNQQYYWQQQPTLPPVQGSIAIPDSLQAPPIQAAGEFNQINYRR